MGLLRLEVAGLRNLAPAMIEPGAGLNFVVGENASGKSSLLEAIYLLGRARSFRTTQINQLIAFGASSLTAVGKVSPADQPSPVTIGMRIARGEREARLGGRRVQASAELLQVFPLLVIQPAGIALLDGSPRLRRQFLDFGVFHHDCAYLETLRRYGKALSQRNVLLRGGRARDLGPWNQELSRYGIMIHEARSIYIERLLPFFQEVSGRFFAESRFELRIHAGWDHSIRLSEALERDIATDLRYGHTHSGPHKGDFSLLINQRSAKSYASRGQMKLLVYALLLAQSRLMEERVGAAACVLIDDVASELDEPNKRTLLDLLHGRPTQFFITATSREIIEEGLSGDAVLFRIAQGHITQA